MRKLFSLIFICLAMSANARQNTADEAATLASEFLNSSATVQKAGTRVDIRRAPAKGTVQETAAVQPYYVFNAADDKGFVIISGDDRAKKILGYSDKGNFDMDNMPPQLSALLDLYAEQISKLTDSIADPSWFAPARSVSEDEGVLLETANWGQGYPYNAQCPIIDGVQAPTGCVATAMAIVMKYIHPTRAPKGYISYTPFNSDRTYSYVFDNLSIDYASMKNSYNDTEDCPQVAELMKALGHSVATEYGITESGAVASLIPARLREYFGLSPECQFICRNNFQEEEWTSILKEQINNNRPVIYIGRNAYEGHAFVCDGYSNDGSFHVNWGWDGIYNGFYQLNDLLDFGQLHGMVINLSENTSTREVSRIWIDAGDYGCTGVTRDGVQILKDFKLDETIPVAVGVLNFPKDFSGMTKFALIDENDNIILSSGDVMRIEKAPDQDGTAITFSGVFYALFGLHAEIPREARLCMISLEDGDDEWKFIVGTLDAPGFCKTTEVTGSDVDVAWNLHNWNDEISLGLSPNTHYLLTYSFTCYPIDGIVNFYRNGTFIGSCSDSKLYATSQTLRDSVTFDAYYMPYSMLKTYDVTLSAAGSLDNMILTDLDLIYSLKLTGKLNQDDLYYISKNLHSLKILDLSNAEFENNLIDLLDFPFLEILKLPEGITQINCMILDNCEIIEFPKSLKIYPQITFLRTCNLQYFHVLNPNPDVEIPYGPLCHPLERKRMILFVPKGTRDDFLASPKWTGYRDIIECDGRFDLSYVDIDNCRYLTFDDCATYICKFMPNSIYNQDWYENIIPARIISEGKEYEVRYGCTYDTSEGHMIDPLLYLEDGFHGGFYFNNKNDHLNYIIETSASVVPQFKCPIYRDLHIPGGATPYYTELINTDGYPVNLYEMWEYTINQNQGLITIKPIVKWGWNTLCSIDKVIINGQEVIGVDNQYSFKGSLNELDVVVEFSDLSMSHRGLSPKMTSHYSPEVNQNICASIDNIQFDNNIAVTIYNLSGGKIYTGLQSDIPELKNGIYIVKQGSETRKIYVK